MYGYDMERDEISLFVHQLLLRSTAAAVGPPEGNAVTRPHSSSIHSSENDEVNLVDDEVQHLPAQPPRPSSKRSRGAEIHNQSEKRRRSRINEKLKALQNMIPNSNKTDKASMLDEAIEYLKQLQLQVQMLSVRNRISLQSMCLPGAIQPAIFAHAREGSGEDEWLLDFRLSGAFSVGLDSAAHNTSVLPKQYSYSTQLSPSDISNMLDSERFCGLETSLRACLGAALLHKSSDVTSVVAPTSTFTDGDPKELDTLPPFSASEVTGKDVLPFEDLYGNNLVTNASELGIEAVVAGSLSTKTGSSFLKGSGSQEMFGIERNGTDFHPKNRKGDLFNISDLIIRQTISASNSAVKMERPTI